MILNHVNRRTFIPSDLIRFERFYTDYLGLSVVNHAVPSSAQL